MKTFYKCVISRIIVRLHGVKSENECIFSRQGMHVASVLSIQMCWLPELF